MEASTASNLSAWASIISSAAATISVIFAFRTVLHAISTRDLGIVDEVFNRLAELEEKLQAVIASGRGAEALPAWKGLFFNRLEYFSFLVNKRYLTDPMLVSFFSDAVMNWYETIFEKLADESEKADPSVYPELKALYKELRLARNSQRTESGHKR